MCRFKIIAPDSGIGGIEVCNLIVREHTHGCFKDIGKLICARFILSGNEVELILT